MFKDLTPKEDLNNMFELFKAVIKPEPGTRWVLDRTPSGAAIGLYKEDGGGLRHPFGVRHCPQRELAAHLRFFLAGTRYLQERRLYDDL